MIPLRSASGSLVYFIGGQVSFFLVWEQHGKGTRLVSPRRTSFAHRPLLSSSPLPLPRSTSRDPSTTPLDSPSSSVVKLPPRSPKGPRNSTLSSSRQPSKRSVLASLDTLRRLDPSTNISRLDPSLLGNSGLVRSTTASSPRWVRSWEASENRFRAELRLLLVLLRLGTPTATRLE